MARITGDDVLEQIGVSIETGLVGHKVDKAIATDVAVSIGQKLRAILGGQNVYFPMAINKVLAARDKEIFHAFNGTNSQELAMKHGVSEMRIRQIIKQMTEVRRQALKAGLADQFNKPSTASNDCAVSK